MERHEVPTHLLVRDKVVFGLTVKQLFTLGTGLVAAYSLWPAITLDRWHLTLVVRLVSMTLIMGCAGIAAFVVIARQPVDAWVIHWAAYVTQPRCLVWRAMQHDIPKGEDDDEEAEDQ